MDSKLITLIFLLVAAFACHAVDTNKIWRIAPHSGSDVFSTNVPIPTAESVVAADLSSMILSLETNCLKSGVFIGNPPVGFTNLAVLINNEKALNYVCLAMLNTSTNLVYYLTPWPKRIESQYEIKMVDEHGKAVPKTAYGQLFGRAFPEIPSNTLAIKAQRLGLHGMSIFPKSDSLYSLTHFDPVDGITKCFTLNKEGNYKLTLIHHIYMEEARSDGVYLRPVTFSPITIDVQVENNIIKGSAPP